MKETQTKLAMPLRAAETVNGDYVLIDANERTIAAYLTKETAAAMVGRLNQYEPLFDRLAKSTTELEDICEAYDQPPDDLLELIDKNKAALAAGGDEA